MLWENPRLLLVACAILPNAGSEPAKGTGWSTVLARFYRLDILTMPTCARALEKHGVREGCRVHAVKDDMPPAKYAFLYHWELTRQDCHP